MLYIFGGLPAVGKTTIAKELAQQLRAVYIRIDTLEQSLIDLGVATTENMEAKGYIIAHNITRENIRNGVSVVVDCVNPIEQSREEWRNIGLDCSCDYLEIEVICSDINEHRLRVEKRKGDISNLILPTWDDIVKRFYEPWTTSRLIIDSSKLSVQQSVETILHQEVYE